LLLIETAAYCGNIQAVNGISTLGLARAICLEPRNRRDKEAQVPSCLNA